MPPTAKPKIPMLGSTVDEVLRKFFDYSKQGFLPSIAIVGEGTYFFLENEETWAKQYDNGWTYKVVPHVDDFIFESIRKGYAQITVRVGRKNFEVHRSTAQVIPAHAPEPALDWTKIPVETPIGAELDGFHDMEG